MTEYKDIPYPGKRITSYGVREKEIRQQFLAKFNRTFANGKIKTPTFLALPDEARRVDIAIFSTPEFLAYDTLYFSVGDPWKILYEAAPDEIAYYLLNLPPYVSSNDYVFDKNLQWCISFSHERTIHVVGDLGQ